MGDLGLEWPDEPFDTEDDDEPFDEAEFDALEESEPFADPLEQHPLLKRATNVDERLAGP